MTKHDRRRADKPGCSGAWLQKDVESQKRSRDISGKSVGYSAMMLGSDSALCIDQMTLYVFFPIGIFYTATHPDMFLQRSVQKERVSAYQWYMHIDMYVRTHTHTV